MMFSKPVALITGACAGMGEGFTLDLVSKGWQVAMVDIKRNETLESRLRGSVSYHAADVSDYYSQANCFQDVWDKYGRLDLVCANAGTIDKSSLYILNHKDPNTIPPKPNLLCTEVNVKGVYYGAQLAIHFMRKNQVPGGNIVVTASASSLYPHECYIEYSGSKAAVWNFVRASARVLKLKENIRINCIRPGFVPTSLAPPGMIAAAKPQNITPLKTIVSALNKILENSSLIGQALECSIDKVILTPEPEFLNGEAPKRASFVWEPGFKALHGEPSGLPDSTE